MPRPYLLTCITILLMVSANAFSQIADFQLIRGNQLPATGEPGMWFENPAEPLQHYVFKDSAWVRFPVDGKNPRLQEGIIMLENDRWKVLATVEGKVMISNAYRIQRLGQLLIGSTNSGEFFAMNIAGDTLSFFQSHADNAIFVNQILEDGTPAFCLPQYGPRTPGYFIGEMRSWGLLDGHCNWIIPPIYDGFFHFDFGRAHVMHYGIPHTINERGEIVD